jgi:hypothetical protein
MNGSTNRCMKMTDKRFKRHVDGTGTQRQIYKWTEMNKKYGQTVYKTDI